MTSFWRILYYLCYKLKIILCPPLNPRFSIHKAAICTVREKTQDVLNNTISYSCQLFSVSWVKNIACEMILNVLYLITNTRNSACKFIISVSLQFFPLEFMFSERDLNNGLHSFCIFFKCLEKNRETYLGDNLFQGFRTPRLIGHTE